MSFLQIFLLCSFGVGAKYHALRFDLTGKGVKGNWQSADVIAFLTKPFQEIIHRRYHLQTTCQKRIFARSLEIANGYAFLAVLLLTERHVAADVIHQHLAPFCFSGIDVIAFLIGILCGNRERCRAAVNLRNDDTGVLGSTTHGNIFIEPFLMCHGHRERAEEGDILLLHPLDERVVAQAPHCHVDHTVGFQLVEHLFTFLT